MSQVSTRPAATTGTGAGRRGGLPSHVRAALVLLGGLVVAVTAARSVWPTGAVQGFVARYPGVASGAALTGTPVWVGALHAANLFLMVLVVRSGLAVRTIRRSAGRWTRRGRRWLGRSRTASGASASPRRTTITLEQWLHVGVDLVWLAVGALYVALLVGSGRWVRLLPTSWDVVPNAASVALQYLALHWRHEDGWVAYNALQMLAYGAIVFLVSPLAAVTGLRLSALWPQGGPPVRAFPVHRARAVHHPVMLVYLAFVALHLGLVVSTGALRNLNHMFGARDDGSPVGALVAVGVLALAAAVASVVVRPVVLRPLASLFGKVTR